MKEGWQLKKLGEVCRFINGKAYSQQELLKEGKYPVLRVGNFYTNNHWYYSNLELDQDKYCENGDLLYAWSASFGPRIWEGEKSIYHYHIWKVIPDFKIVTKEFLFRLFQWDTDNIKLAYGTGTTMMHVGKGSIENRSVPIPALSEQLRIVSLLDECFASIDQAKANLSKNLNNAKELFQSELNQIFSQKGEGWVEKKLGDVFDIIGGGTPAKNKEEYYSGDLLWATVRDMKEDYLFDTQYKITQEGLKNSSSNIVPKDHVIIATRVGLGKVCLLKNDTAINQDLKGFIPKKNVSISNRYLFLWFKSISKKIIDEGTGATVQGVKLPFINNLDFPLPSLAVQQSIVSRLDALSLQTKKLESIYQQKLNNLEELKKSILQKAFAGELVRTPKEEFV